MNLSQFTQLVQICHLPDRPVLQTIRLFFPKIYRDRKTGTAELRKQLAGVWEIRNIL